MPSGEIQKITSGLKLAIAKLRLAQDSEERLQPYDSYFNYIARLKEIAADGGAGRAGISEAFLSNLEDEEKNADILVILCEVLISVEDPSLAPIFSKALQSANMELKLGAIAGLSQIGRYDLLPDIYALAMASGDLRFGYNCGLSLLYQGKREGIDVWLRVLEMEKKAYKGQKAKKALDIDGDGAFAPYGIQIETCLMVMLRGFGKHTFIDEIGKPLSIDWYEEKLEYFKANKNGMTPGRLLDVPAVWREYIYYYHGREDRRRLFEI